MTAATTVCPYPWCRHRDESDHPEGHDGQFRTIRPRGGGAVYVSAGQGGTAEPIVWLETVGRHHTLALTGDEAQALAAALADTRAEIGAQP